MASEEFSSVIVFSNNLEIENSIPDGGKEPHGKEPHGKEPHGKEPRYYCANQPKSFTGAMNTFLKDLNITLRTDRVNGRPRINQIGSGRDQEQKKSGQFIL